MEVHAVPGPTTLRPARGASTAERPARGTGLHEGNAMPAFITLVNFTDQGARSIKDSPERFEAYKALAEGLGVTVKSVHWTQGAYDLVLITEGPEEGAMLSALKMAQLGNVRTQTMRGYSASEMRGFVKKLG